MSLPKSSKGPATFAFYISTLSVHGGQHVVLPDGRTAYLRIVKSKEQNDLAALDKADPPKTGEQFMNTHML